MYTMTTLGIKHYNLPAESMKWWTNLNIFLLTSSQSSQPINSSDRFTLVIQNVNRFVSNSVLSAPNNAQLKKKWLIILALLLQFIITSWFIINSKGKKKKKKKRMNE